MAQQERPLPARVLLVDDDEHDYALTRRLLAQTAGTYDLRWAETFDDGLAQLTGERFDVCLVDLRLGDRDGLELLREAGRRGLSTPMILLTAHADSDMDAQAQGLGASGFLEKGKIDAVTLDRSLRYALAREHLVSELIEQNTELLRLHKVTEHMLGPGSRAAILARVAQEVARGTGFPIVSIDRYRPRRRVLECLALHGLPLPPGREPKPVDRTLAGEVVLSGQPRMELELDGDRAPDVDDLPWLCVRTYLCLPIVGHGETLGALTLAHPEAVPVDSDQVQQARALAAHVGRMLPGLERRGDDPHEPDSAATGQDLREDLTALVTWYAREARRRGLRLEQEVLAEDGSWPRGDAIEARRTLGLMLSCAMRYGCEGELRVQVLPDGAPEHVLVRFPAPATPELRQACRQTCEQLGASLEECHTEDGDPALLLGARLG